MILTGGTLLVCFHFPAVQNAEKGDHRWKQFTAKYQKRRLLAVIHGLLLTEGTDLYFKHFLWQHEFCRKNGCLKRHRSVLDNFVFQLHYNYCRW